MSAHPHCYSCYNWVVLIASSPFTAVREKCLLLMFPEFSQRDWQILDQLKNGVVACKYKHTLPKYQQRSTIHNIWLSTTFDYPQHATIRSIRLSAAFHVTMVEFSQDTINRAKHCRHKNHKYRRLLRRPWKSFSVYDGLILSICELYGCSDKKCTFLLPHFVAFKKSDMIHRLFWGLSSCFGSV